MNPDETKPKEDPTVLEAFQRFFSRPGETVKLPDSGETTEVKPKISRFIPAVLVCFLAGQFLVEFLREALGRLGLLLLLLGFALAVLGFFRERKRTSPIIECETGQQSGKEIRVRLIWLLAAFVMSIGASLIYRRGRFDFVSTLLWIASIISIIVTFAQPITITKLDLRSIWIKVTINRKKTIAYLLLVAVVLVFQFGRVGQVPSEIISSQVEAYYTVDGITKGDSSLWFPRNVINEPVSYYWVALVDRFIPGTLSFTEMKLAFALAGLVAVFYMYKLGRRLFGEKSGFISALLLGVGFWSILQQRAVLGFGLILPIMLPALYYLYKSLQEDDLNSLLIASVLTGIGLLTNKIFIFLVIANLIITIVYLAGHQFAKTRITIPLRIAIGLLAIILVVLPMVFVVAANSNSWLSPIMNQLSTVNNPASGSPIITFSKNLLSALGMTNWLNRSSWADGIANRAALDWVSGAVFLFGICVTLFHDFFTKQKQVLSLLILFVLMLLPSAFSIAQPMENPSLSRALGAAVPVFLIAGRGCAYAIDQINAHKKGALWVKQGVFFGLFAILLIARNFSLINTTYQHNYQNSSWNATEMAQVIRNYDIGQAGSSQAYIIGYPHWVDARSVAISLGEPYTNLSILPQDIGTTIDLAISKIFLLNLADSESLLQLQSLYPAGVATTYQSVLPEKNFIIFIASQ